MLVSPRNSPDLKREHRTNVIICGALLASTFVYAALVEFLRRQPAFGQSTAAPAELLGILRPAFYGLSLAMLLAVVVARGALLKKREEEEAPTQVARFRTAAIATGALAETPAIYGLVLFMLGREPRDFYCLGAYALVLQIAYFPTRRKLESWIKGGVKLE